MLPYRRTRALRVEEFRVQLEDCPGWVWGTTRVPRAGEEIFCAGGAGTVTAVHGKTGNGSLLVQIGLTDAPKHPFFAAASNVLLPPVEAAAPAAPRLARKASLPATAPAASSEQGAWLAGSGSTVLIG